MNIRNQVIIITLWALVINLTCNSCSSTCRIVGNKVECKHLSDKYGIILDNSDSLSLDEICEAETLFLGEISKRNHINLPQNRLFNYHRQYCKKTIDGDIILLINFVNLKYTIEKKVCSSELVNVLTGPSSPMINNLYLINLTKHKVCDIQEFNTFIMDFVSDN